MISKPLVVGLLAIACVTAAAGGAYMAVRQNHVGRVAVATSPGPGDPSTAPKPVAETETVLTPAAATEAKIAASAGTTATEKIEKSTPQTPERARATATAPAARPNRVSQSPAPRIAQSTRPAVESTPEPSVIERQREPVVTPPTTPATSAQPELPAVVEPPPPPKPELVEVVIPAASVIGLQVETSLSSENARVEDRVDARVTRDVLADGRVAVPAGARMIGNVTVVERGGKVKERARLGVRFHTVVLADGTQVPIRTDSIYREGASPGAESARKIGGAAVGGAILGAILGGGKGAAIGGATGAAGGTAVVMAGDRNAATLPAGTILTVRVASPVSIEVEKEPDALNR
jgi:hypothetical protein